jgi:hypothetical protein
MTKPVTGLEAPSLTSFSIICGSTDSDEEVPRTMNSS